MNTSFDWARSDFHPSHPEAVDVLRGISIIGSLHRSGSEWAFVQSSAAILGYRWPIAKIDEWTVEYLMENAYVRQTGGGGFVTISDLGVDYLRQIDEAALPRLKAAPPIALPPTLKELCQGIRRAGHDHAMTAYYASVLLLRSFLGADWVERNVLGEAASNPFFRVTSNPDEVLGMEHNLRVIHLAEMLLNLQKVSGFPAVLTKIRRDSVESAFAELETGKILSWAGVPFRFVEPTGRRGSDYDLLINFRGNRACGDTKCRIEGTDRDVQKLIGTLNSARTQLPSDAPGILFIKTPREWMKHDADLTIFGDFERASTRFLRGTQRVVLMVFYTSMARDIDGHGAPTIILKEFANPNHRFDASVDWSQLLNDLYSEIPTDAGVKNSPQGWQDIIADCV